MTYGLLRVDLFDYSITLRVADSDADGRPGDCRSQADAVCDVILSPEWLNGEQSGIRVRTADPPRIIQVELPTVSGVFADSGRGLRGTFRVGGDGCAALDGLAGLALAILCESRGDLLLHASAVETGGGACLFLGPGGSGKTTIAAELNDGRTTFCVDKAVVSARPDGVLRVHATPFGAGVGAGWRGASAAIAGMFFIEQADRHEVVALSRWEAARRLFGQTVAPSREQTVTQRTMNAIGTLAEQDRSFLLRFRRDPGFWPLVDAALARGR